MFSIGLHQQQRIKQCKSVVKTLLSETEFLLNVLSYVETPAFSTYSKFIFQRLHINFFSEQKFSNPLSHPKLNTESQQANDEIICQMFFSLVCV